MQITRKWKCTLEDAVQQYKISLYLVGGGAQQQRSCLEEVRNSFGPQLVRPGNYEAASLVFDALREQGKRLVSAESCTGGMIGAMLTDVPGISDHYWGGFISYDNGAKTGELLVDPKTIESPGAVSEEAVLQMARGALRRSGCEIAVAVSGIAGPGGGTPEKPVGTVWIGVVTTEGRAQAWKFNFGHQRGIVRRRAAVAALLLVELTLREPERLDMVHSWHYS